MITSQHWSIRRIARRVTTGRPTHEPVGAKEIAMIRTSVATLETLALAPAVRRRGVVLVVVLAMLGLLAVIGVSFATYSNQALIASRRFVSDTKANVDPDSLLSYALEQLVNDSNNRLSSLRGHSLKRDMYGNDSAYHGLITTVPNLDPRYDNIFPKPQIPPTIVNVTANVTQDPVTGQALLRPAMLVQTNIPVTGTPFDGYDFTRWVMKVAVCNGFDATGRPLNQDPTYLTQTVEVLNGSWSPALQANGRRRLLIAAPDTTAGLAQITAPVSFSLDGRFLRAFNGTGVTFATLGNRVQNWGVYPNMRLNSVSTFNDPSDPTKLMPAGIPSNPDQAMAPDGTLIPALDEDYDAADLENWFLALQSADGSLSLPSFHRPGIVRYDMSAFNAGSQNTWASYLISPFSDWNVALPTTGTPTLVQMAAYAGSAAKFLRPRAADGHDRTAFPNLVPDMRPTVNGQPNPTIGQIGHFESDPTTGMPNGATPNDWTFHPGYDVDNDGDGYPDSVWLDLGFPVQTDPNGKKYKPLFAFLIVGLNGRLPLNTAGNLHDRDIGTKVDDRDFGGAVATTTEGTPKFNHASHLGASVTEINPKYALRHTVSPTFQPTDDDAVREIASSKGLRGLLAGYRDGSTALPGRWGDARYLQAYLNNSPPNFDPRELNQPFNNPVRPGKSMPYFPNAASTPPTITPDASDDDADAFDFLSDATPTGNFVLSPERGDATYPAASRNLLLASERQRRFVTPIDPVGTGRLIAWNRPPYYYPAYSSIYVPTMPSIAPAEVTMLGNQIGAAAWFGRGSDNRGRIGYFGYYRPPGVSVPEIPPPNPVATTVDLSTTLLNPFHGYESFRNPLMILDPDTSIQGGGFNAAMPFNFGNDWESASLPTTLPYPFSNMLTVATNQNPANYPAPELRGTFTRNIASDSSTLNGFVPAAITPGGLLNRDEADEQNLYDLSDQFDEPFRASDLADLYLKNSTFDDTADPIRSRVANLFSTAEAMHVVSAPKPEYPYNAVESLEVQNYKRWPVNPRKLFAHESWDTNRFSWSPDNPGGAFSGPDVASNNANFRPNQSASAPNLSTNLPNIFAPLNLLNHMQFPTPSLALGDRRINLNFPFPAYDYQSYHTNPTPAVPRFREPTRLKWLRETYQLMLRVLPPKAVDTPLEKAQLAQFLVNVVDFRDPDGVMTLFTAVDPNTSGLGHGLYQTIATPTTPSVIVESLTGPPANTKPLDLWGMEYNPVALNEVMAYEFKYWETNGTGAERSHNRIFIELLNTLTASGKNGGAFNQPDPADLNMLGWEFVVAQDSDAAGTPDATGRPDPFTGQLPTDASGAPLGRIGTRGSTRVPVSGTAGAPLPAGKEVKAMRLNTAADNTNTIYSVFGNSQASDPAVERDAPDTYLLDAQHVNRVVFNQSSVYDTLIPDIGQVDETEKGRYFWLYLTRPADPGDPINSPKVVVDSIRFPYMVADAERTDPMTVVIDESDTNLHSVQRIQPFRGAHAVRNNSGTPYFPFDAYGYSEQGTTTNKSNVPDDDGPLSTRADSNNHSIGYATATGKRIVSDSRMRHTIGDGNTHTEDWQHFPFNDRDFQSVAELLHVPSVGPGRFTKMFVENQPQLGRGRRDPTPRTTPDDDPPDYSTTNTAYTANYGTVLRPDPPVFPYLSDRFFYTAPKQEGYNALSTLSGTAIPVALQPDANAAIFASPSADGWHRMLEFFEVPSSMNGAIGPVTEGENGDWYRESRVPGKLNLNLIVDEEVFMGLIDDSRLNLAEIDTTLDGSGNPVDQPPRVATGQFRDGAGALQPLFTSMPNRGYVVDPNGRPVGKSPAPMKQAFSDFLKLRHGGSGTMLAFGEGATGTTIARERPFRSLSFPDINDTVLRPGALPPSPATAPALAAGLLYSHNYFINPTDPNILVLNPANSGAPLYLGDPGIRNLFLDYSATFAYAQPPAQPFRRLFQIPDAHVGWDGPATARVRDWDRNSNASLFGNPVVNQTINHTALSTSGLRFFIDLTNDQLDNQTPAKAIWPPASLFVPRNAVTAKSDLNALMPDSVPPQPGPIPPTAVDPTILPRPLLGANVYQSPRRVQVGMPAVDSYALDKVDDRRQHPLFRTELLQKVMNLTTVRTNQFAVYVTVGFFEVKKEGNVNTLQPDILGPEIDKNSRYTSFAVIDRTKAEGFNPLNPGAYRDLVEYERRLK